MKSHFHTSFLNFLEKLVVASWRRPRLTLLIAGLVGVLALASTLSLRFKSGVGDLAPAEISASLKRLEEVFRMTETLIVVITTEREGAEDTLVEFAEHLALQLADNPRIRSVTYGWGALEQNILSGDLLGWAPAFVPSHAVEELDELLTPEGIRTALHKQLLVLGMPGLGEAERWIEKDPLGLHRYVVSRWFPSQQMFDFREGSRYFLSRDGRSLLVRVEGGVRSSDIPQARALVASLRRAEEAARGELRERHPETPQDIDACTVGLAGGYPLALESEAALRTDLTRNLALSVALIVLILLSAWRHPLLVAMAAVALFYGILLAIGLFALLRGEVVTLAMVSGAVLAALGIDFSIHLFEPLCSDERGLCLSSLRRAVVFTAPSLTVAGSTTMLAFLSFFLFSDGFLADLGLITSFGIAAIFLSTMTLFPALLSLWAGGAASDGRRLDAGGRGVLTRFRLSRVVVAVSLLAARRPWVLLSLCLLASVAAVTGLLFKPPAVEDDLRRLHPSSSTALHWEEHVRRAFGFSHEPIFLLIEGKSETLVLDGLVRLEGELQALLEAGSVRGWTSAVQFLSPPSHQERVFDLLRRKDSSVLLESVRHVLHQEGFDEDAFEEALQTLDVALSRREALDLEALRSLGFAETLDKLIVQYQDRVVALVPVYTVSPLSSSAERQEIFGRLQKAMDRAEVSGELAGFHVASSLSSSHVIAQFLWAIGTAFVAVALSIFVFFRGIGLVIAGLVPILLGTLWIASTWGILDLRINFMNVGILPMVLGIGVDDGVHIVARVWKNQGRSLRSILTSTMPPIVLTTMTNLAAFGTLSLSSNPGLASVGVLSSAGLLYCLLATLLVLPALLAVGERWNSVVPTRSQRQPSMSEKIVTK